MIFTIYEIFDLQYFICFLLTDNLVVKLQVDVLILIPARYVEAVGIELSQPLKFLVYPYGLSEIDDVVAYARHDFDGTIGQYIDLLHLTLPELVAHEVVGNLRQCLLGVLTADSSRGNDQVGGLFRLGNDIAGGVEIIAVAVGCYHMDGGHTLADVDDDMACQRLIALRAFNEGIAQKRLFNATHINPVEWHGNGIDALALENRPYFLYGEESL